MGQADGVLSARMTGLRLCVLFRPCMLLHVPRLTDTCSLDVGSAHAGSWQHFQAQSVPTTADVALPPKRCS